MDNFILGLSQLRLEGANRVDSGHECIYVSGAGIEASVEEYGFYWDDQLDCWVWYT
jgi:hypothetical protein